MSIGTCSMRRIRPFGHIWFKKRGFCWFGGVVDFAVFYSLYIPCRPCLGSHAGVILCVHSICSSSRILGVCQLLATDPGLMSLCESPWGPQPSFNSQLCIWIPRKINGYMDMGYMDIWIFNQVKSHQTSKIKGNQVNSSEIEWNRLTSSDIKTQMKSKEIKWNQMKAREISWNQVKLNECRGPPSPPPSSYPTLVGPIGGFALSCVCIPFAQAQGFSRFASCWQLIRA